MIFKLPKTSIFLHKFLVSLLSFFIVLLLYLILLPYCLILLTSSTIYFQTMCALFYFSYLLYLLLLISVVFYLLPNILSFTFSNYTSQFKNFNSLNLLEISKLAYTFPILTLSYHSLWISPSVTI